MRRAAASETLVRQELTTSSECGNITTNGKGSVPIPNRARQKDKITSEAAPQSNEL
jgi:hypothetical protein